MLTFLGGWREFSQSTTAHFLPTILKLLVLPPAMWIVARSADSLAARVAAPWPRVRSRFVGGLAVVGLAAYVVVCQSWISVRWNERSLWQARVARNVHWTLLRSLWRRDSAPTPVAQLPPGSYAEFVPQPSPVKPASPNAPPPNVILLVLESVGANYLQAFGGEYANTPELLKLADRAWFFDAAYAQCPSSAKSLVALLSGTYPRPDVVEQTRHPIGALPGVAACLGRSGYRTGFLHSGNWDWRGGEEFVRAAGFEHFQDARHVPVEEGSWGASDDWLLAEGLRWIDAGHGPFFLTMWTIETHHPYRCEEPAMAFDAVDAARNRYLNGVAAADRRIGLLWREIERRGLADSTVLVVTGDHGEAFGTHGQRLHVFGVYEENVRVPLVLVHDGKRLPVGRTSRVAEHVDLAPTIAQLCGATDGPHWQGRSLLEPADDDRAYFYTVWDPVLFGLREGDYKYVVEPGGEELLFHLPTDRAELHNLAASRRGQVEQFRRRINVLRSFQHDYLTRLERRLTR
jgi:arylsulfatase A-like enzyme